MKKVFFYLLIFTEIGAYQPPEFGLFFENSIKQFETKFEANFLKEKKEDGTYSNVYNIKNLSEFLHFSVKQCLPLIINIYSENNATKKIYQEMAQKFSKNFIFISIDELKAADLVRLLTLFLKCNDSENKKFELPLFLICEPNSVILEKGLMHFKKGALRILLPEKFDKQSFENKLKEYLDFN